MSVFGNASSGPSTSAKFSLKKQESITAWLFILPTLIGFSIFTFGSIIYSFFISLTDWDLLTPSKYIGFSNYLEIFKDADFWQCMYNTVYFVVALVPSVLVLSMFIAIIINKRAKSLSNFFRVSFFMPSVTSTVAVSMVWLWMFNPDSGIFNNVLHMVGLNGPRWLEDPNWAKPALIVMRVWQMCGYYMIMFLAGLQTIPENLYEAAEVDGATKWQKTKNITIPMLANTTFVVAIMLVIEAFNIFEAIFVMTDGGPAGSTNTIMYYIYSSGFKLYRMGYASALAWVFFAILFILTLVQFKFKKEK